MQAVSWWEDRTSSRSVRLSAAVCGRARRGEGAGGGEWRRKQVSEGVSLSEGASEGGSASERRSAAVESVWRCAAVCGSVRRRAAACGGVRRRAEVCGGGDRCCAAVCVAVGRCAAAVCGGGARPRAGVSDGVRQCADGGAARHHHAGPGMPPVPPISGWVRPGPVMIGLAA